MQKFSKSPAVLEAEKGGKFQMFDGNITGEYVELVSNYKVTMVIWGNCCSFHSLFLIVLKLLVSSVSNSLIKFIVEQKKKKYIYYK